MTQNSAKVSFFSDCNISSFRNKNIVHCVEKEPQIFGNNIPEVTQANRANVTQQGSLVLQKRTVTLPGQASTRRQKVHFTPLVGAQPHNLLWLV